MKELTENLFLGQEPLVTRAEYAPGLKGPDRLSPF
jgi:hypothetical protein